jgi:hypothetical protein
MIRNLLAIATISAIVIPARVGAGSDDGWVALTGEHPLDAWRTPTAAWYEAGDAKPDPKDARKLIPIVGRGVIVNGRSGRTRNLLSKAEFGDIEAHFEFLIPRGSNSGIKFEGLYEIQIFDSHGVATPTADDCGGVYPRAELLPKYHHIDDGIPPRVNAARPFGHWQTLDVVFRAPRFGADGKKTADARLDKVTLNGQVIHEGVALKTPTGHAWHDREVATGPLFLQADHGPVAFRNIRVRALDDRPAR